jgi:CRP/FNR family cyclic AMP-dependent transcriptional regulator
MDEDPALCERVRGHERAAARQRLIARALWLRPGTGDASFSPAGAVSLLVLDGALALWTTVGARSHLELLGGSDLLAPWAISGDEGAIASDWRVEAILPTRVAVLDESFAERCADLRGVGTELMHRLMRRARRATLQAAINATPNAARRVELILWHLADRWGRVTPDGVRVDLALTHVHLAAIVGARRSTVTSALADLRRRGAIAYEPGHGFLLTGPAPADAGDPTASPPAAHAPAASGA